MFSKLSVGHSGGGTVGKEDKPRSGVDVKILTAASSRANGICFS